MSTEWTLRIQKWILLFHEIIANISTSYYQVVSHLGLVDLKNQYDQMSHNSRETNRFFAPI